jgi:hypothetical protein
MASVIHFGFWKSEGLQPFNNPGFQPGGRDNLDLLALAKEKDWIPKSFRQSRVYIKKSRSINL